MERSARCEPARHVRPVRASLVVTHAVYTDYDQFYVQDSAIPCDTAVIWDAAATTEHPFARSCQASRPDVGRQA